MIIGRDLTDENKYLNNTIKKIRELLDSYGVSSKEQDKEIINHRKFLWDNRNELDEIEINENSGFYIAYFFLCYGCAAYNILYSF